MSGSNTFPIVIACLGPGVLFLGLVQAIVVTTRRRRRRRTVGEVLRWEHSGSNSTPVIGFTTDSGQQVEAQVTAMDIGLYLTGRQIPVWYDPRRPQRCEAEITPLGKPGCMLLALSLPLLWVSWLALQHLMTHR